ncbi:MAG: O-antigen ligase family protein [Candidatus Sedimenticola sp. (ex Thyasira tokunagai)]
MITETLRALIIILAISGSTFYLLSKPYAEIVSKKQFSQWRNNWLLVVILFFLIGNFWLFSLALFLILYFITKNNPDKKVSYYLLFLFALPMTGDVIPGFGIANQLFELNVNRLMVLLLLFPSFIYILRSRSHYINLPSDKYIYCYIALLCLRSFEVTSISDGLRSTFTIFVDIFLPYYVLSRLLTSPRNIQHAFVAILLTSTVLVFASIFEAVKHWHLYHSIATQVGAVSTKLLYLERAGSLRATTVFSSSIVLGFMIVIATGLLLYIKPYIKNRFLFYFLIFGFVFGLYATFSRGPWVGFVVLMLAYLWTGKNNIRNIAAALSAGTACLLILFQIPLFDRFTQLLPFIGSIESGSVYYRKRLFEIALDLLLKNPLLGDSHYRQAPELEELRQGQGIIDIVNSYVNIALSQGLIGLTLFLLTATSLLLGINQATKRLPTEQGDLIRAGRSLFAMQCAMLVIISTVSSIDYVPVIYWAIAGISAAYIYTTRNPTHTKPA